MDEAEKDRLKAWVLRKLARGSYWGQRPTDLDNIPKGAPKELYKVIKKDIVDSLANDGFLLVKPGLHGPRCSLNSHRKEEILSFIEKYYPTELRII